MVNAKLRETLPPDALVFDNPSFDNSIIGVENGRVVYDYDKMVEELMIDDECSYEDAVDFIDYNTIRSLPYYPNAPIVKENDLED